MTVPSGYHTVTPYLVVPGVARLIDFLTQAFEARELQRHLRPDSTVQHAEVTIGDSVIMMGEPAGSQPPRPGMIHLYVADGDAAYQRALHAGATSLREPADLPHGVRMSGVEDPHGNQWWIATRLAGAS